MAAFVYVVSAENLSLSKIGYTQNLRHRLRQLDSNSASPYRWQPWTAYRFNIDEDARRVERVARRDSSIVSDRLRGKVEFYSCRPWLIAKAIERCVAEHNIDVTKMFPTDASALATVARNFPSMPQVLIEELSSNENAAYWQGARDALSTLSFFEGLILDQSTLQEIMGLLDINEASREIELWETIVGVYRNGRGTRCRMIAEAALVEIQKYRRWALEEWQENA